MKSKVNLHPFWSIFQMMGVCLYVRTLREAALFKFFDISCSLSKPWLSPLQVPSPHCLGKRFSWLFRVNENRCLSTIERHCDGLCALYVVRCTRLSVWPLPLKAATTNSSCTPETSGAFQVGELPVSFPRQSDRPLSLLSFWGHNFFCQQCASDRRHYSLLCTIFSICQTDNSCQLPKLTMTHVWPSFEYSFTHAKDKDDNAKDERKSRFLDPKEMEWLSLWLNFVSFYLKGLIPLNNEKTPISLKCQPLQVFFVFFFEVIVINQAGSSNLIT